MTEMDTLSILILAWLRWKEVSTLTTSNMEFVLAAISAPELSNLCGGGEVNGVDVAVAAEASPEI